MKPSLAVVFSPDRLSDIPHYHVVMVAALAGLLLLWSQFCTVPLDVGSELSYEYPLYYQRSAKIRCKVLFDA